ncbi:MAG: carboxymuconolactone decarboxylase family protein [Candidatus Tectimicrobiota bacterium]
MSELDARYARGQETRRMFGGGTLGTGSVPGVWDVAPDLERILGEALFGTIWRREALSPVQREIITLSTLIVLDRVPQLRQHLGNALNVGLTPEQLVELIIHATWYGGAPAGINALASCQAVFAARGIAFTPPRVYDTTQSPEALVERGNQVRQQYMGGPSATRSAPPTEAERAFNRISGEYYWGATWSRPGLDLASRCLCTLTCLAALGRHSPLRTHIRAALHIGFTQDQVIEVFLHLMLYGGIPFAREAIDVANEVFAKG